MDLDGFLSSFPHICRNIHQSCYYIMYSECFALFMPLHQLLQDAATCLFFWTSRLTFVFSLLSLLPAQSFVACGLIISAGPHLYFKGFVCFHISLWFLMDLMFWYQKDNHSFACHASPTSPAFTQSVSGKLYLLDNCFPIDTEFGVILDHSHKTTLILEWIVSWISVCWNQPALTLALVSTSVYWPILAVLSHHPSNYLCSLLNFVSLFHHPLLFLGYTQQPNHLHRSVYHSHEESPKEKHLK